MNYSKGQYRKSNRLFVQCRGIIERAESTVWGVACCQREIRVYIANTEAIVGAKCENV